MKQPSITAKALAAKVAEWPTNGDPVFVTWEHDGMSRKIRLFKDERGETMQCRCQCAVRMFYPHPMGRDDCCIDCHRKIAHAFEVKAEREAVGRQNARKPVKSGADKAKSAGRGKAISLPVKQGKKAKPARRAA